jgi:hypothetical protein
MSVNIVYGGGYKNMTSSANVAATPAAVLGFFCNSITGSATVTFYDNAATTTSRAITGAITPGVGWNPLPVNTQAGLYAVISGTINITVVWSPQGQ